MEIESINPKYYTLKEFTFTDGTTLNDLSVEYLTLGTPNYDENNNITNAIIYFHGTTGNYASIKRIKDAVGRNLPFDTDKFFFVSLSTLGTPGSSCPSTSELYNNYPEYNILDMVNFNRKFLNEALNIKKPLGLIAYND